MKEGGNKLQPTMKEREKREGEGSREYNGHKRPSYILHLEVFQKHVNRITKLKNSFTIRFPFVFKPSVFI